MNVFDIDNIDIIMILTILKIGVIILSILLFFNYDKKSGKILFLWAIVCSLLLFLQNRYILLSASFTLFMLAYVLWVITQMTIKSRLFNVVCIQLLLLASAIIFLRYTMAMQ